MNVIDETQWFEELGEQFKDDPEYITHGLLLDVTAEICEAMEEQDVSRVELAGRLGVVRQRVSNFLNTPSNTTLLTIVKFAQALGLNVKVEISSASEPRIVAGIPQAQLADQRAVEQQATSEWIANASNTKAGRLKRHGHLELAA